MTINEIAVRAITYLIEEDLNTIESGGEHLMFLFYHPETGALVPLDWVTRLGHPEWLHDWNKFMNEQTFMSQGYFLRDVQRFLTTRLNKTRNICHTVD